MAALQALAHVPRICGRTRTVPGPQIPQSGKLVRFAGLKILGAAAFCLGQKAAGGRSVAFGQMSPKLNR